MKYGFPYACYNLGELSERDTVVVPPSRSGGECAASRPTELRALSRRLRFAFFGGHRRRFPVRLQVPRDRHWFVALDRAADQGIPEAP